jgi:hypothetical protein
MEACGFIQLEHFLLPENVGARERCVSAQVHLDRWREPPQIVSPVPRHQESGFGQIHLASNGLHPLGFAGLLQDAHCRGISGEWPVRKRVDLCDR